MTSKKLALWLIALLPIAVFSCSLPEVPEVGDYCENAEYYSDSTGVIVGDFSDPSDPYYQQYQHFSYCPKDYSHCEKTIDDHVFCRPTCQGNAIFCTDRCIDANTDQDYCGAKGKCNDPLPESDDYSGITCSQAQVCRSGKCSCTESNFVLCNDSCIDPANNSAHCGARGMCNNLFPDSDDYSGEQCVRAQICTGGTCMCPDESHILCGNTCIDPLTDKTHCGAQGSCSELDQNSPDWQGQTCRNGYMCIGGECKIECTLGLHDEDNDCVPDNRLNCGAKGVACAANQICSEGKCADSCSESEVECEYQNEKLCVIPETNPLFCDADQNCNGYTRCDSKSETCSNSRCLCRSDHHPHDGSCEPNDNENCGAHEFVCEKSKVRNSVTTACSPEGICDATSCAPGFHVYNGKCEANTIEHCGNHTKTCDARQVIAGAVVTCSDNGECEAAECLPGYHVYNGACEKDDHNHCGKHNDACTKATIEGSETVSCSNGTCIATSCDSAHQLIEFNCISIDCRDGETMCMNIGTTGFKRKCINSTWTELEQCKDDLSCNSDGTDCGICINDTNICINEENGGVLYTCSDGSLGTGIKCASNSCNAEGNDCSPCDPGYTDNGAICCKNIENGTITTDSSPTCHFTCNSNYHVNQDETGCEINSVTDCGSNHTTCPTAINGSAMCSTSGMCSYYCNNTSYPNLCTSTCVNFNNDVNNCGSCGNKCIAPSNGTATCSSGTCGFTCKSGYCKSGSSCVSNQTDVNNCGSCGNKCTAPSNGTATCSSGTCWFTCNSGYCGSGSSCVSKQTDVNNCGTCGTKCTAPSNGTATCSSGTCGFTCNSGYCRSGSSCVSKQTDVNNCGSCGNKCNTAHVMSSSCSSGQCVVTACEPGYHVSSDGTCKSDDSECLPGLHINTTDGKYTNSLVKCITGDVTMSSNTTEVSMPNLETVSGKIQTGDSPELKSLSLPKLSTAGSIIINKTNLSEAYFPALTTISNNITFVENEALTTINAPLLKTVGNILGVDSHYIHDGTFSHSNLESILFPLLTTVGQIYIDSNFELIDIDFSSLKRVEGRFAFSSCDEVLDLELPMLEYIGGTLDLYRNLELQEITIPKLTSVAGLQILSSTKLSCSHACKFKNIVTGDYIIIRSLKESSCNFENSTSAQTFAQFCSIY